MNPTQKPYLLLVDDDSEIAEVYRMILEAEGYRVLLASDGVDALRVLQTEPSRPALILTDLMMPRMSGFEFCRRLAATPGYADVPVVVISAVSESSQLSTVGGIKVAFPKPPTIDQLLDCVDTWGAAARVGGAALPPKSASH